MEKRADAYIKRDAAGNILVDINGNITCESKEGVIFQLKYKDIDFSCDTVQCTVEDQLVFIKLHQNVKQNEQTSTNNEQNNNENYGHDENTNYQNYTENYNENYNENNTNGTDQDKREIFFWDDAKTKLFLQLYKEKKDLLINRKIKTKKVLWQKIRESMQTYGHNVTLLQVENKYKSLERSYKNMITNNNKTGRGRISCPYETELNELMGHKHNIQPLAVSGKQGLLLRDDVRISTSLPICDINNQSETNLDTVANIEPMTPNLLTNTTISEINVSNVENNCFNNTLSHNTQRKQTGRTTRVSEMWHKTIEKLLHDTQKEKEIKNEIQRQLITEYKAMRNTYEQSMKNIEEQLIKANQLREEKNKLLKEIFLENKR